MSSVWHASNSANPCHLRRMQQEFRRLFRQGTLFVLGCRDVHA